jgi:hypothetical protein
MPSAAARAAAAQMNSRLCRTKSGSAGFTFAIRQPISRSEAKLSFPPSQ